LDTDTSSVLTKKLFPGRFYDAFFIGEYGRIEAIRANRYNTCFSLILIGVESAEGLEPLKKLVATVLGSVRSCDITGLSENGRIMIILPETDYFGALIAAKKLSRALSSAIKGGSTRNVLLSSATFPRDGRTFSEITGAADRKLAERKDSLWEKLNCSEKLFWEIVGSLNGRNTPLDGASLTPGRARTSRNFSSTRNEP
jgi:hypothetical protein